MLSVDVSMIDTLVVDALDDEVVVVVDSLLTTVVVSSAIDVLSIP